MPDTEIRPQLDPEKPVGDGGGKQPRPMFPGFIRRVAALAIDFITIYMVAFALNAIARPALLSLGEASGLLAAVGIVAYFWACYGRLGKGATLGKQIMEIRVVNHDGAPLNDIQALKRALILTAPIWVAKLLNQIPLTLDRPVSVVIAIHISNGLAQGVFLANAMCFLFDPLKRALHDYAVRSHVVDANYIDANLGQRLFETRDMAPTLPALSRAAVAGSLILPLIISLPLLIGNLRSGLYEEQIANQKRLNRVLGSDEFFVPPLSPEITLMTGEPAEDENETGPFALKLIMRIISYRPMSSEEIAHLQSLDDNMDELLSFLMEIHVQRIEEQAETEEGRERIQERRDYYVDQNIHAALIEIRPIERLDLAVDYLYPFDEDATPPIRGWFTEEQAEQALHIQPTTATLARVGIDPALRDADALSTATLADK